ncbi:hypothetical protein B0H21DRAFT_668615, partial [Amylocystis lapponica]
LLLYISAELEERDIPHRTKTTDLILEHYAEEKTKIATDAQNVLGRVSFTSDLWSDGQLRAFMAVTLHYMVKDQHGRLALRARL